MKNMNKMNKQERSLHINILHTEANTELTVRKSAFPYFQYVNYPEPHLRVKVSTILTCFYFHSALSIGTTRLEIFMLI